MVPAPRVCVSQHGTTCTQCGAKQTAFVRHRAMADMLAILPNYAFSLKGTMSELLEIAQELTDELCAVTASVNSKQRERGQQRRGTLVVDIGIALLRQGVEGS